jgi:hypothetical protein
MGKTCQLATCAEDASKVIKGRIGQSIIEIDVCAKHAKGIIVGTLKDVPASVRTFRVVQEGCPVCAFADECQHEHIGGGRYVLKK